MTTVDANSVVLVTVALDDSGSAPTVNLPTATGLTFAQIGTTLRSANNFNLAIFRAYTTASLGSTAITGTWSINNDWNMHATDFTGTAGTSGNNGSDAIGTTNTATGSGTTITVTVASSSHNNSKYFGAATFQAASTTTLTQGASYTLLKRAWDATWTALLTEISTSPVTPAASTAVNATATVGSGVPGVFGVELLVGAGATSSHLLACLGAGS